MATILGGDQAAGSRCSSVRGGWTPVESNDGATVANCDSVNAAAMIHRATRTAGLAQNLSVFTVNTPSARSADSRSGMNSCDRDVAGQRESDPIGPFRSAADRTILCGSVLAADLPSSRSVEPQAAGPPSRDQRA